MIILKKSGRFFVYMSKNSLSYFYSIHDNKNFMLIGNGIFIFND